MYNKLLFIKVSKKSNVQCIVHLHFPNVCIHIGSNCPGIHVFFVANATCVYIRGCNDGKLARVIWGHCHDLFSYLCPSGPLMIIFSSFMSLFLNNSMMYGGAESFLFPNHSHRA